LIQKRANESSFMDNFDSFIDRNPTLDTYWRAIILLGNNVASYKFALAQSLLEIPTESTLIRMEDLAIPFAKNISAHLKHNDKQITSASSKFLDVVRRFNANEIAEDELRSQTVRLGFVNVIDAFHNVAGAEVPRFFEDKRNDERGIILTDNFYKLLNSSQSPNLTYEVDSRWRLWETAISLGVKTNLLEINIDSNLNDLYIFNDYARRIDVTSSREALNGYQKGKCFYCERDIIIDQGAANSCDVDHFFPHILKSFGIIDVDQVWNLVLSCKRCNRGEGGKFERIAHVDFLYRLNRRNNYYVQSHHPLKETIIKQTGRTEANRREFLQDSFNRAVDIVPRRDKWKPPSIEEID
jgi:5-methylcytosine-specific restriction endonuclease McrA